ncbi:Fasciclin-like arabinogalactan protein 11 [Vitis vinifera]|uniref:Fasciclin-like arabinogalactan protein 11 n=1 Tax=Vitis vinifera TaxID=29760 RepID=A0A438GUC9_VITVI|nr:Fasciclin-like arabinogalactan protein 11 [Vitis vinifera]
MMTKLLSPTLLLLIFSLLCTTTSGQPSAPAQAPSGSTTTSGQSSSPPAPSPSGPLAPSASSGPADIIAILRKTSNNKFSIYQHQESLGKYDGVTSLPNSSSADLLPSLHHYFWSAFSTGSSTSQAPSGSTTTAGQSSPPAPSPSGPLAPSASSSPADIVAILRKARNAFSDLKTGTLNSFTDNQKAALTKFHIINSFLTISQFQTVNMTTGLVNTTVDSTVYSDGQLAVYEIPRFSFHKAPSRSTTSAVDSSDGTALPTMHRLLYPLEWLFLRHCACAYELVLIDE